MPLKRVMGELLNIVNACLKSTLDHLFIMGFSFFTEGCDDEQRSVYRGG